MSWFRKWCEQNEIPINMNQEIYTPGSTENASNFMMRRRLETHGAFFKKMLKESANLLDCGCGPGSITLDLASALYPGQVTGIDANGQQIELARKAASRSQTYNVDFIQASAYELPFKNESFDLVFSNALMEHLSRPDAALREFKRVLKPGGCLGLSSPDWGGFVVFPEPPELSRAMDVYQALQTRNGGDVYVGRKLGSYVREAGFTEVTMGARCECYEEPGLIGEYLALQLADARMPEHAEAFREWSKDENGFFSQTWMYVTGRKPQ